MSASWALAIVMLTFMAILPVAVNRALRLHQERTAAKGRRRSKDSES